MVKIFVFSDDGGDNEGYRIQDTGYGMIDAGY
jgi:hypothetical protein